jgi:adenylate cyclase
MPMALWTPQFAKVLGALDQAGAAVVGVDLLFATTTEGIEGMRGYDRPLREALQRLGTRGRIVLAKANVGGKVIDPHRFFAFAVGGQENIRSVAVTIDRDGVVRHVPLLQSGFGRARRFQSRDPTARSAERFSQLLRPPDRAGLCHA